MKINLDDPTAEAWGEDGYVGNVIRLILTTVCMLTPLWILVCVCFLAAMKG